MKKTILISILGLAFVLSACSQQPLNKDMDQNDKALLPEQSIDIDPKEEESQKPEKENIIQEANDNTNEEESLFKDENSLEKSNNIKVNFLHLEEYPVGHKIYIRGESTDKHIRIQNYQCEDDMCKLGESDFWIEISNRNNFYGENNNFIPEKEFDEYEGILVFGDNEFYNGLGYGPYTANAYVLKTNPNIQIRFYANSNDELISMILESISIEKQ